MSPVKNASSRKKKRADSESDNDFQAESEDESEPEPEAVTAETIRPEELDLDRARSTTTKANSSMYKQNGAGAFNNISSQSGQAPPANVTAKGPKSKNPAQLVVTSKSASGKASSRPALPNLLDISSRKSATNVPSIVKPFRRIHVPIRSPLEPTYGSYSNRNCPACHKMHPQGACELKAAGVEHCGLCGLAHYGHSRTCPHIKSETQVRAMLEALRNSNEPKELVDLASKYLRGVKGTLVQQKKRNREKAAAAAQNGGVPPLPQPKPRGPPNNAGKIIPYAPGLANGAPGGPPSQYPNTHGPSQREVPSWTKGPVDAPPRPKTLAEQQRMLQMQAHGHVNEQEMDSALRGYLGH
jgi:chromodomain-helicase-DNA-binding protein 4